MKPKFLLLIVLSAIIFTGLIGAIFLFKIPMVSAVDYYTSGTPFVALWNTSNNESGTTNSTQIGLPLENGGEYNFTVYWGDGTSDTITAYNQAEVNHTYETEGIKTITINGSIKGFRFNNKLDKLKLINISSWGDLRVGNNGSYFKGCYYMNFTGSDNLNTTDMTKFSSMFYNCSKFNGNISNWDTSSITAMDYMFRNADVFNSSIANWDTSKVTDMKYMFSRALLFNQNISNWNTGKVTIMEGMFNNAPFFNQPIGNWNTSSVTSIASMFESTYFNQSIANWDTSKVTTLYKIFYNNSLFNQNISNWNTGKVTTMAASFYTAYAFNQPIGNWNTSSLWDLRGAFQSATSFNQNLTGWDTSKVTNMSVLFSGATSFNGNISNWDTSNVNNISSIFQNNYIFNQDLGDWNVSSVTHMIKSFDTVNFSKDNYDSILNGWADDVVQGYINVSFFGSQYSYIGEVGRNILTGTYNWTITDGGNWNKILVSNFSNSIGVINDYFYGVHLAGQEMTMFNIDINDNGNVYEEEKSNSTWNKNAFYNSGMKTFRIGICIEYGFENGIFSSNNYSNCNANERKNLILWAHENGYKVILVAAYVPLWLADNQSWCKYTTTPRGYTTCAPNNYTRWGQLVTDYLDAVDCDLYPETCLVEVWNEPDLDNFWLEGLAETHANKTLEYNKLYNATWYAVKAKYPLVKVGGPAVSDLTMARSQLIYKNWLGNFSNQSDFFSFHEYWDDIVNSDTRPDLWYKTNFDYVFNNLTYYGSNITEVYLDEWNMRNATLQYNPSLYNIYAGKVALSYMGALNGYPSNLSMHFFQWTSPYHNGTMQTKEESYDWRMVAEPNLLNAGESSYKAPYNVTKNFAHVLPSGCDMKVSSSDNSNVKIATCQDGSYYGMAIINSGTEPINATVNLSLTNGSVFYPYNNLTNYETYELITVGADGIAQLGVLDQYEILYLSSGVPPTITQIQPANLTTNTTRNVNFSANLTDDVGLTNSTLFIFDSSDNSLWSNVTNYISGEISIESWLVRFATGTYNWWIELWDDEGKQAITSNYTLTVTLETNSPAISYVNPTPTTSFVNSIPLNVTVSDANNVSVISDLGLNLWLRLNNETGENYTFVKDYSKSYNNGTIKNGAVYDKDTGKFGGAYDFDGINDYIQIENQTSLNITENITISAWVRLDNYTVYRRIVAKSTETSTYPYTTYGLLTGDANKVRMEFSSGGIQHIINSTSSINVGEWTHIVGTYNGTNANLYINGVLDNSTIIRTYSNTTSFYVSNLLTGKIDSGVMPVTIGGSYYRGTDINALIDEVMIYNRTLSLNEIQAMYNGTRLDTTIPNLLETKYNITSYAQDEIGNLNSTTRNFTQDNYGISMTYNTIGYETNTETYIANISNTSTVTNAYLNYSGTSYSATITGGQNYSLLTATIEMPTSKVGANTFYFYWNTSTTTQNTSSVYSQTVSPIQFGLCNASLLVPYLNLTFKDETTDAWINASIPSSTWVYYLGNGSVTKTLSYISGTDTSNYSFCALPGDRVYHVDYTIQYRSGTDYPPRIWNPTDTAYTGTALTNTTLYLLSTSYGITVTFQVVNTGDTALSGVEVNAYREVNGINELVASGTTATTGSVTFWLNPSFVHNITFVKSGYTTQTFYEQPTQTQYTVVMEQSSSTGGGTTTDYSKGVRLYTYPVTKELYNDTDYNFIFNVTSSYWTLDNFGFNLRLSNGTIISGSSSTTEGTGASKVYNVNNQTIIYMDYYWKVDSGTYKNGSTYWVISNTNLTDWSIKTFFTDFDTYMDSGLFGIDNFGRYLISFLVLFLIVGVLGYKFGMTNPIFISVLTFSVVFFLDVIVGLIPAVRGIEHLVTYVAGLITLLVVVGEVSR